METTFNNNSTPIVDLSGVEESKGFEPIPAGKYLCATTNAEVKPTNNKLGAYVKLELTVQAPEGFKNRKLWTNFNVKNQSEEAERIGKEQLKAFMVRAGHPNPDKLMDVQELVGYKVVCAVKKVVDSYGEKNEIGYFEPKDKWETTTEDDEKLPF